MSFECLPCAEGCDICEDSSPCVAELNWPMRMSILILACAVIGFLPPAAYFTFRYQQVKVSYLFRHKVCTTAKGKSSRLPLMYFFLLHTFVHTQNEEIFFPQPCSSFTGKSRHELYIKFNFVTRNVMS